MKYWSRQELRRLLDRRRAGENTELLAAEQGISGNCLRRHWRDHLGVRIEDHEYLERRARAPVRGEVVYRLRRDTGLTFREIAEQHGIADPAAAGARQVQSILDNYCRRVGCVYPAAPRKRRRCGVCSQHGHDARTCPTTPQPQDHQ